MSHNIDYSHLSAGDRIRLISDLANSLQTIPSDDLLTAEQFAELDRISLAVRRGEEATYPWEQVYAEMREGR